MSEYPPVSEWWSKRNGLEKAAILFLPALLALGLLVSSFDEPDKSEATTFPAPRVQGQCPGQMYVGLPVRLKLSVKNPGKVAYPATYFAFWDGSDHFVINAGSSDGAPGIEGDYGLEGGYQFRGVLKPGESRNITILMTPKDVGNFDELKFAVWGEKEDINPLEIPSDENQSLQSCENIAINPGL